MLLSSKTFGSTLACVCIVYDLLSGLTNCFNNLLVAYAWNACSNIVKSHLNLRNGAMLEDNFKHGHVVFQCNVFFLQKIRRIFRKKNMQTKGSGGALRRGSVLSNCFVAGRAGEFTIEIHSSAFGSYSRLDQHRFLMNITSGVLVCKI